MGATGIYTKDSFQKVLEDELRNDGITIVAQHYVAEQPLNGELEEGHFYLALRGNGGHTFGCVALFTRIKGDSYRGQTRKEEVIFKWVDESMGPALRHCPKNILDKLTPLDKMPYQSEYGKEWREQCMTNAIAKEAMEKYNNTMHKLSS